MNSYKKIGALGVLILVVSLVFTFFPATSDAYVSVKGYYRSNGTYVRPHVRSNPNGLKYDNYSWTPSQGLYNTTYGTRGASWDTPTYITDPDYYLGKSLYESGLSGVGFYTTDYKKSTASPNIPSHSPTSNTGAARVGASVGALSVTKPTDITIPPNAHANYYGTGWSCDNGYKKNYTTSQCDLVIVPANAYLNYSGDGWICSNGFKKNYTTNQCDRVSIPPNASLNYSGDGWYCNNGYKKNYTTNQCDFVTVPPNASLNYSGDGWYCNSGYKTMYDNSFNKVGCEQIIIPVNASLNYSGSDWYCNSGYKTTYNNSFNKVGCEQIVVPLNAHLNYSGSDWYCDSGYKTVYNNSFNKVGCTLE